MSNHLEPTYLRYIYDGLVKGSIHPENAAELPDGLIGLYDEVFDERTSFVERQKLLQRFAIWALLKKEVSAAFVAEVLRETEDDIQEFISTYSAWFNSPESGKYQLYHERLKVYLLQRLSEGEAHTLHEKLILRLEQAIEEQKADEFEWYGLEFLGGHYSVQFQIIGDQSIIERVKKLTTNSFFDRQISFSGRYKWTTSFYHETLASLEISDDKLKYAYYYQLCKFYVEEEDKVEQIIREIDYFPIDSVVESIENLGSESLFEKQRQFTAYFNAIFNLMEVKFLDLDKLKLLNSKLENCSIHLLSESEDTDISFFPYPLMFLLGAKLNSLGINPAYLYERPKIYKYTFGAISNLDESLVLMRLNLQPIEYFNFIQSLIVYIETCFISAKKDIHKYDIYTENNPVLNEQIRIYWDLKIKHFESIKFIPFEIEFLEEFLSLIDQMQEWEVEKHLLLLPKDLGVDKTRKLYQHFENNQLFKASNTAVEYFDFLERENLTKTAHLILNDGLYSPNSTFFLLTQLEHMDRSQIESHFSSYANYIKNNKFDYVIMDDLFSNYFLLFSNKRIDAITMINRALFSTIDDNNQKDIPYSDKLYLLRLFELPNFLDEITFNQIIQLKNFKLKYFGSNENRKLKQKILNQNLEEARSEFLKEGDNFTDPNDYFTSWELSICELAIKLGMSELVIQLIPKIHFDFRFELLNEVLSNKKDLELIRNIDAIFCLDENKFGLDNEINVAKLRLGLITKSHILCADNTIEKVYLLEKALKKIELSYLNQERYILNIGKTLLREEKIQLAVDLLPYLMNYCIPSLSIEIAVTILKLNKDWEEFHFVSEDLLKFYEEQTSQDYASLGLNITSQINHLFEIINIAEELNIERSAVVASLLLVFDFTNKSTIESFIECIKIKSINNDFFKNVAVELIISNNVKCSVLDQLYFLSLLPKSNLVSDTYYSILNNQLSIDTKSIEIGNILDFLEKADTIEEFYPNSVYKSILFIALKREHLLESLLLLGLLPQTKLTSDKIKNLLQQTSGFELKNETDIFALSYFLKVRSKIKDQTMLRIIEDFAQINRFSIYSMLFDDAEMHVEFPNPGGIEGKTTLVRNEVFKFNSTNYTENGIWHSDNEQVAIVDENGFVSSVGIGKATITLTAKGVYSTISNSSSKSIEVIENDVVEIASDRRIRNELAKPADQINFSPLLYKTMKDKKIFFELLEQHAVYKTYFPEEYENYHELAHELFDLSWMNFNQEPN
jgi:hypothetical protein